VILSTDFTSFFTSTTSDYIGWLFGGESRSGGENTRYVYGIHLHYGSTGA